MSINYQPLLFTTLPTLSLESDHHVQQCKHSSSLQYEIIKVQICYSIAIICRFQTRRKEQNIGEYVQKNAVEFCEVKVASQVQ